MENRSQFAGLYKKDMSIDNLRAKVARRKSITQKENRHKEFRKSRGLSLADVNISVVKEQDLTVVEEVNESYHVKVHESKQAADTCKAKEQITNERRAKLQRFKEEKQLRKLKEQREKANKAVFKCGIYKADVSFIPVPVFQNAVKVKQKEKPSTSTVTRVTRSTAARDPPGAKSRAQPVAVTVLNKASTDRVVTRGRGQGLTAKKNEKENKVSVVPPARSTRATAAPASKLPTTVKAPLKNTAAGTKPEKKITKEKMIDKTEPPVTDPSMNKCSEPEVALKEPAVETTVAESVLAQERKPSFAPQNFVFQPLDGLAPLKFQPMTPNRANAFLTPSFTWSPVESKRQFVFARDHHPKEKVIEQVSPTELKATDVHLDTDMCSSLPDKECGSETSSSAAPCTVGTPPSIEQNANLTEMDSKSAQPEPQHDVPYFRGILKSEIQRLQGMSCEWDKTLDTDIPEDAKDLIRTTVGQTRLLMTERFKQFEGLVDHCEFKTGEKETTCTDLEGFWDMIYFQIEDVCKKFANLEKLQESSWQQNAVQVKRVVRKKTVPAAAVKQNQGDNGRSAARSRLAAIKAALKHKGKTEDLVPESAASEQPMQVDPIVFDAGFFRIESPAKVPNSRKLSCSSSQTSRTPKSTKKSVPECPVVNDVEETVEGLQAQKSPTLVKSPVRKALFGTEGESLQSQEINPMVTYADNTEPETVPAVVDLTKYLIPTENTEVVLKESSSVMECLGLEISLTAQDEVNIETSMVDDVFMCSPEKAVHTIGIDSTPVVGPKILTDEEAKATDDPLDFLGSCTPIMVHPAPLMLQSVAASDLIMFSPLEK